jgi:predicted Zn-dependent protease
MSKAPLRILLAMVATSLVACGTNPVTGAREIQFISEAQELKIGEQQYAPTRQSQGGDLVVLPDLSAYVSEVGQKLATVADRDLPYEFVVLNSSVPNAWALPGGKIAVNRGLLTELDNEAELAAVLGHEIVHAAARHGAKAQERGTLMQAGLAAATIGAAVGGVDQNLAALTLQGAGVGAQMIQQTYGRDQELEADEYGMNYMVPAGYDPQGAVTLQETFVRLANEGPQREQNWFEGLFASHPPSEERVAANRSHAQRLGPGGDLGEARYQQRIAPLLAMQPAYDKFDEAMAAAQDDKTDVAKRLASEAVELAPTEGRFHQLLGEIALSEEAPETAIAEYEKAIDLNPEYFGSYLGGGVAQLQAGNPDEAKVWLTRSAELLPTAPAAYYLGNIARDEGNVESAARYYRAAAGSQSGVGKAAAAELAKLELPSSPGNYIATAARLDQNGRVLVAIENRASVAVSEIQVTPVLIDGSGRIVQQGQPLIVREVLAPGAGTVADPGLGVVPSEQLPYLRFRVDQARVAQ